MTKILVIVIGIVIATGLVLINGQTLVGTILSDPIVTAGWSGRVPAQDSQAADLEKIRQASVSIVMLSPVSDYNSTYDAYVIGRGLGSLVEYRGEILLVTHNHWGAILQDASIIEFNDADGRLRKAINGNLWKSLVVYQDPGSLILRYPGDMALTEHLVSARQLASMAVEPGELVSIAYRGRPEHEKVAVLQAIVEEITDKQGVRAYKLRSLDGQLIQPGDSGGGVWHDGALVGNNWISVMKADGNALEISGDGEDAWTFTDRSYAARLPGTINGKP